VSGLPVCIHPCGCCSDVECPHYDCGDMNCPACTPLEDTTLVSLIPVVLKVPCPRCGEWARYPCRSKNGKMAGDPHVQRWAVAKGLGLLPEPPPLTTNLHATFLEGAIS